MVRVLRTFWNAFILYKIPDRKYDPLTPNFSETIFFAIPDGFLNFHINNFRFRLEKSIWMAFLSSNYCIIGANVVRAHARFPCEGRRSGH